MKLSNVYIICIALMAFFVQSCSKMNDLHQPYLDEGETIYAAKVDSVIAGSGKGRIQLEMFISSQRIETVRIFWNDYKDSVDMAIGGKTGSFKKLIEKLVEKSYIFQFVSLDKFGHKSLPVEVSGKVYGEVYETSLSARAVSIGNSKAGLVLTFATAPQDNVATEVTYTGTAGALKTISVPASESSITISDNLGSQIGLKSTYKPVNGVDDFVSAAITRTFNPYAGTYQATGVFHHPANGDRPVNETKTLNRITDEIVECNLGDLGSSGYLMRLKVNTDLTVTITPAGSTPDIDQHWGPNYYDPATRSFHLFYSYNTSAPRKVEETITLN